MYKIKEFIKNEKYFIFGMLFMILSELCFVYQSSVFKLYNIDFKNKIILILTTYYSVAFFTKGLKLFFPNDKDRE